ncbi:MAG: hypothetical protein ACJ8D5_06660 [Sphingomicrobium sp.]
MTYGLTTRAFVENGPAVLAEQARLSQGSSRTWRALDEARRLELIERALKPCNDVIDAYPLAL